MTIPSPTRAAGLAIALVVAGALTAAACDLDQDEAPDAMMPPTGVAAATIQRYVFKFDLTTRHATAKVSMNLTSPGNCVELPFRGRDLTHLMLGDRPALASHLSSDVLTVCGRGWPAGTKLVLSAELTVPEETWGDSQVGYSVSKDAEGAPFSYLVSWIGGCDRFTPCDTATARFAHYRFEVTHPAGTRVLCPGVITPGDTTTVCEFDYPGGPTYSTFAIAASPSWTATDLGVWSGVHVTLYDSPSTGIAEAIDPDVHRQFLAWMIDNFGPYPYGNQLRLATGPTYWSGFEHPGNILLYDGLAKVWSPYTDPLGHTINHEIVHQWAGDQTTLAQPYDFVWKEAMAEYLTFVFEDEHISHDVALATARAWKQFGSRANYYPVPEDKPSLLDYYGDVYGPGPMILFRQLEVMYGRYPVMEAIASLLGHEHAIGVKDVESALEEATGVDLASYFDTWIYGKGTPTWPVFDVTVTPQSDGSEMVAVAQEHPEKGLFGCAFSVELVGSSGATAAAHFDLGPDGAAQAQQTIPEHLDVTKIQFDPDAESLAYGASTLPMTIGRLPAGDRGGSCAGRACAAPPPWRAPTLPTPYTAPAVRGTGTGP